MKKLLLFAALLPSTILANSTILDVKTINGDIVQITPEEAMKALSETAEPVFKADREQFGEDSILYVNPKIKYGNEYITLGAQFIKTVGPKFCDYIDQGSYTGGEMLEKKTDYFNKRITRLRSTSTGFMIEVEAAGAVSTKVLSIACKIKPKKEQNYYFNSDTNSLFSM